MVGVSPTTWGCGALSNLHRLQWIDAEIRVGKYPNARSLAEHFEISRRQALRDFEYLRDSLGAPLAYSAIHRGFFYGDEAYVLPGPYVTPAQKDLLGYLAAFYSGASRRDSRFAAAYAEMAALFNRLGGAAKAGGAAAGGGSGDPAPDAPQLTAAIAPYRAILRTTETIPSPSLEPFWRGAVAPGSVACEFSDPLAFIAAMVQARRPARVEWPSWLRERVQARLDEVGRAQDVQRGRGADEVTSPVTPPLVSSGCDKAPAAAGDTKGRDHQMTDAKAADGKPAAGTARRTTDARFQPLWTSYGGAAYGVLRAAGSYDGDITRLMGQSGLAFHLIWHETCCPSSVTVYDWADEHQTAMERVGVLAESFQAMPGSPTYEAARRRAVDNIKAAVDRGVGVILWGVDTGEFGVVYGYDDADGVFLVDGVGKVGTGSNPILYENVGKTFEGAPILHYQAPVAKVPYDPAWSYRESLAYYVRHMESPSHIAPAYRSGLLAYDNLARSLERRDYNPFGLRYGMNVYTEAKELAADYLWRLADDWDKRLAPAAETFKKISAVYARMGEALGGGHGEPAAMNLPVTPDQADRLLPVVREAKALESEALARVKAVL